MLVNLSNHPSADWSDLQLKAASKYGKVMDLAFPAIDPNAETYAIKQMADIYEVKIRKLRVKNSDVFFAVHLMGELTFCFGLVIRLQKFGITCVASTTSRTSYEHEDGLKTSRFEFVKFREYPYIE